MIYKWKLFERRSKLGGRPLLVLFNNIANNEADNVADNTTRKFSSSLHDLLPMKESSNSVKDVLPMMGSFSFPSDPKKSMKGFLLL